MANTTAMKARIDLAKKIDPTNIEDIANFAKSFTDLKNTADALGFVIVGDPTAKVGSYDFGESAGD